MKVKYINTWKGKRLQYDKLELVFRLFPLTVFAFVADWSKKEIYLSLFNMKFSVKF
jgi:hypothetical protein